MSGNTDLIKRKEKDVVSSMFLSVAVAMIFTQMVGVIAIIIDGTLTSSFISEEAYAGISLLNPMFSTISLFSTLFSSGSQVLISKAMGKGDKDDAQSTFSFAILSGLIISLVFILLCVLIPQTLFRICGVSMNKRPELLPHMLSYTRGYMIGIPAMVCIQIIGPVIIIDGGKKRFSLCSIVFAVTDVLGDLLNAFVFKGGAFGMGLATSISYYVQLGVLVLHFMSKTSYFKLSLGKVGFRNAPGVLKAGSPTFFRKIFTIGRDLITNHINLAVAVSAAAVVARGLQTDLNLLMFCIGLGMGRALLSMTGIFYSADDRKGMRRLFAYSMKATFLISSGVGTIVFLAAPLISRMYTRDPAVLELSVFSIRFMAISLPLDAFACAYQDYLQGIQRLKLVNAISLVERFFIPIATAFTMGRLFGSKGVLASLAIGKIILIFVMYIIIWVSIRHLPRKLEDFMFLPDGFGGAEEDNIYARLNTIEDVMEQSERARQFCLDHGVDKRKSTYTALFIEEMGGNIILHGKPKDKSGKADKPAADYRIRVSDGKITITLRDYCKLFDPQKYIEKEHEDGKGIGIKMVYKLATETKYFNAFNSNNILILLKYDEAEKK